MNKKISRLLEPGMGLYFFVLVLFAGASAALQQYYLAAGEGLLIILLFIYNRIASGKRKKALMSYIQSTTDSLGTAFKSGSPFPLAVIKMSDSEIVWGNLAFLGLLASAACFVAWSFCVKRMGPAAASAYIYLQSPLTVVWAALLLGEPVTPAMLAGIALVVAGLAISEGLHLGKLRRGASRSR